MVYEDNLRKYLIKLDSVKPVIYCGDLNVAHTPMDIKNPQANVRNAGFTIEERTKLTNLLNSGFIDSFRYMYPTIIKYSWWSYRFNARANNAGWRIDYFLVSDRIKNNILDASIDTEIYGSDHCPVKLLINI
jgi:exodeoxyribonuclease-3